MDEKCHVIPIIKEVVLEDAEHTQAITLVVSGMGCINCAHRVHNSLIDHPGVVKAKVSHVTAIAEVTYLPTKISLPQLIDRVSAAGDSRHTYRVVRSVSGGAP